MGARVSLSKFSRLPKALIRLYSKRSNFRFLGNHKGLPLRERGANVGVMNERAPYKPFLKIRKLERLEYIRIKKRIYL
jgi:hypothetical protein